MTTLPHSSRSKLPEGTTRNAQSAPSSPESEPGESNRRAQTRSDEVVAALQSLIEETRSINTRGYEESDPGTVRDELFPRIKRVLHDSQDLYGEIIERYESQSDDGVVSSPDTSFETSLDQLMAGGGAARHIADISFMARLELVRTRHALNALEPAADTWEHIVVCARIRRRVLKSAAALERAICDFKGIEASNDWYGMAIRDSIEIRRVYAIFRKSLHPHDEPIERQMYARVRVVGVAIARLIGRDIYEDLKVRDRQLIRELRIRVIRWLRDHLEQTGEAHMRSGKRLWQDAVGLANLLMQVNNRPELRDHDVTTLNAVYAALCSGPASADDMAAAQLEQARCLYGLDTELDLCIEQGDGCSATRWRDALSRVLRNLGAEQTSASW